MLGLTLDILSWLQRDQSQPLALRHQRDRAIATTAQLTGAQSRNPAGQAQAVAAWWRALAANGAAVAAGQAIDGPSGRALDRARRAAALALFAFGALLGTSVTLAALHYDGSAPVNLVSVIGVLVLIPGIMLLLTLALLPGRIRGFGWLQDVLATFSPGQWVSAWINRRFANSDLGWRGRMTESAALTDIAPVHYRRYAKWQLVLFSQQLACGFFVAALLSIMALVTFSDLAFGWSTTLDATPERVAGWVRALASPWAGWLPAAAPDPQLVQLSQFHRARDLSAQQARMLGYWWPFLLMVVACYGLLPRVLLAVLARIGLRRAERRLLLEHPQVQRLLERLSTPVVAHRVDRSEAIEGVDGSGTAARRSPAAAAPDATAAIALPPGRVALINWNRAVPDEALASWVVTHLHPDPDAIVALSVHTSLAQEARQLVELAANQDHAIVLTKAYEPPLLGFLDVAQRLKAALAPDGLVWLVPVGIGGAAPAAADLDIWRATVARLDDVRIALRSVQ